MQRYDLRHLKDNFQPRMLEIISESKIDEIIIFLFETIEEESLQQLMRTITDLNSDVLNSLRFNEVDWTLIVKKGIK